MDNIGIKIIQHEKLNITDWENIFSKISGIGYKGIEIYNPSSISAEEMLELSKKYNIKIIATHVTFEYILDDFDYFFKYQEKLCCSDVVLTYGDVHGTESLSFLIDNLNTLNYRLLHTNLRLLYHNEREEFRHYTLGKMALDEIISKTNVFIEYDGFWALEMGYDPIEFYHKNYKRIKLLHVRDGKNNIPMSLGVGNMKLKQYISCAQKYNVDWIIVEMNKNDTMFDAYESYEYLIKNCI